MFDASTPSPDIALMQDRAFGRALTLCGEEPITLPSGLLLLNRRIAGIKTLMLARAAPPSDLTQQLAQAGLARRPLLMSPDHPCDMPRALKLGGARTLLSIDLSVSKESLRAALHSKWRNQLVRAENTLLRIMQRPLTPDHPILTQEASHARRHKYRNWPTALTAAFAQTAPEQTHVFTALLKGHPVAHMLFFTHGNQATYHIGHTTDAGRDTHAHNLLLWNAMNTLAARGIARLDLGPETTPTIDHFKRRAGAKDWITGGTWLRWTPLAR